jgi:hypothetical protein
VVADPPPEVDAGAGLAHEAGPEAATVDSGVEVDSASTDAATTADTCAPRVGIDHLDCKTKSDCPNGDRCCLTAQPQVDACGPFFHGNPTGIISACRSTCMAAQVESCTDSSQCSGACSNPIEITATVSLGYCK